MILTCFFDEEKPNGLTNRYLMFVTAVGSAVILVFAPPKMTIKKTFLLYLVVTLKPKMMKEGVA